ncbi:MAG TPA: acyl-CoA dehydrogenase family protein, partial [Candidatus Hydrogenedentes bacterium]|nr:acyl-CoA dehydrogenase family protein [Candidatus Hydrogenedentota bacterium]
MSNALTDMRNLRFLLYEVFNVEELTKYPFYADHSRETFDMAIDAAYQLAQEVFWPCFQECDRLGVEFDGQQVRVPKSLHEVWRHYKEGGWFAPLVAYEYGGQQFPHAVYAAALFLFNCANTTAATYTSGPYGAGHLIEEFGDEAMKAKYLPPLYTGEWGGTMALTEPDVGTSVGDIKTTAVKAPDGDHYLIKGVKRFITSGDHDITENIIHPVLARIEDAPPGIKGLSLFLVPKYRVNDDGTPGAFNDVATAGVEHKMGIKASATCTLNFGEHDACHAWLIGEANKGLEYMFQLMNRARIFVGIQAVGGASAAYQCALAYARERLQGREVTSRDPLAPQIPIIEHPDVRTMLLRQKAFIEGCVGMILYCATTADIREHTENEEEKERLQLLLELLTPCCKAHGSDGAFESIRLAMQCLGGAGYCEEYPVAQMLRDNKVFSIYEGTN